jgi:hypothetical protein
MPPKRKAALEVDELRVLLPEGVARNNGAVLMKGAGKYDSKRGAIHWQLCFYGDIGGGEEGDRPTSTVGRGRRKINLRFKCDVNNVPVDLMEKATEAALKVLSSSLAKDLRTPLEPQAAAAAPEPMPGPTPTSEQPFAFT